MKKAFNLAPSWSTGTALLLIVLALCGCERNLTIKPRGQGDFTKDIGYFKDSRTGLCFAALNSVGSYGYEITSITYVPCDAIKSTAPVLQEGAR